MKRKMATILALVMSAMLCQVRVVEAATMGSSMSGGAGALPSPIVTGNPVEVCLNSRYSQHSLSGTATDQQISNVVWAAGRVPFTGTHRDIYVATPTGTYLYDPNSHSLTWHSSEVRDEGAFVIMYERELDFDAGVSFMPALLASVSLWQSAESPVASCPKGLGHPTTQVYFGVQAVTGLTSQLVVHSSVPEGQPGWLPDPCTMGDNSLEEVLANLKYGSSFGQTNLTVRQISQILWAGYGCTAHTPSGKAGLTVPSAYANYYLTRSIYLADENGVYRYHNRNPSTDLATRDHRIEQINSADVRGSLQSAVSGLPRAPCYVILCLDSSYVGQEFAQLEVGFVAGNMLIQATAIDLGCHFKTKLTSGEQATIQSITNIPSSHVPQAVVSIGSTEVPVPISVVLQGEGRPDAGWVVPLTVRFFAPGADVLNDAPTYQFNLTTTKSPTCNTAVCEVSGVAPGTYDVTAISEHTLANVKPSVVVSAPQTCVDMGTLLEGDATGDGIVDLVDYAILSRCWLVSKAQAEYDDRADFDRNGVINTADLGLLAVNWLRSSPVEILPGSQGSIQARIDDANDGDTIVMEPGRYWENVDFRGKNLIVRSTDPNNPAVVAATVIEGCAQGPAVIFSSGESASCTLAGFTITGADVGIYCFGTSPTVTNCIVAGNSGAGIELREESNLTLANSAVTDNGGTGIEVWMRQAGRFPIYSYATLTNCAIVRNLQHGIFGGGVPTITNCTIADNGTGGVQCPTREEGAITNSIIWGNSGLQIEGTAVVSYSNVEGGWPGAGNIAIDPCFADPNNGDYHLRSQAGRWEPDTESWVEDDVTSLCIDAGDPMSPVGDELVPNGGIINVGAYGGTAEASKSYFGEPACETVVTGDMNGDCKVNFEDFGFLASHWLANDNP